MKVQGNHRCPFWEMEDEPVGEEGSYEAVHYCNSPLHPYRKAVGWNAPVHCRWNYFEDDEIECDLADARPLPDAG